MSRSTTASSPRRYLLTAAAAATLALVFASPSVVASDDEPKPDILIEEMRYEFGKVFERDFYEHTYTVKNLGDADLVIEGVQPMCGCTAARFDSIIPPGGQGEILLQIDNEKVTLHFDKTAKIYSNDPKTPQLTLSIAGEIIPYVEIQPGGRIYLTGGYGEMATKTLEIFSNVEGEPFEVLSVESDIDDQITYKVTPTGEPGRYQIQLWKNPRLPTLNNWGSVRIRTNSEKSPEKIVQVNVRTKGTIMVQPSIVNFGDVSPKLSATDPQKVVVFRTASTFQIRDVVFSRDFYEADVQSLEDGKKYEIRVRLHPSEREQHYMDEMIIMTDDPREPSVRVRLVAQAM